MLKDLGYLIAAWVLVSVAVTGFAGSAQARRDCPMPLTKGGCATVVAQPGPYVPNPTGD